MIERDIAQRSTGAVEEHVELEEAIGKPSEARVERPERPPPIKRSVEEEDIDMGETSKARRLVEDVMLDNVNTRLDTAN